MGEAKDYRKVVAGVDSHSEEFWTGAYAAILGEGFDAEVASYEIHDSTVTEFTSTVFGEGNGLYLAGDRNAGENVYPYLAGYNTNNLSNDVWSNVTPEDGLVVADLAWHKSEEGETGLLVAYNSNASGVMTLQSLNPLDGSENDSLALPNASAVSLLTQGGHVFVAGQSNDQAFVNEYFVNPAGGFDFVWEKTDMEEGDVVTGVARYEGEDGVEVVTVGTNGSETWATKDCQ